MSKDRERPVFSLYHGRSHGAWVWELLIPELNARGYEAIAHDFDVEADLDFRQHAQKAAKAEADYGAGLYLREGHSWGINPALWETDETTLGIISLAGVPHRNTVARHIPPVRMPEDMHTLLYKTMIQDPTLEHIRGLAKEAFYSDVADQDLVEWAVSNLREHPRRSQEPILERFPDKPMRAIIPVKDMTTNNKAQRELADSMGVVYEGIEGGHSPMLSRPSVLADYMIRVADIFMYEAQSSN